MAVEITKESTKYTWATNSYTFSEFTKTWGNSDKVDVIASVGEAYRLSDGVSKHKDMLFDVGVGILDTNFKKVKSIYREEFDVTDTYWDYIFYLLCVVENIKFREVKKSKFSRPLSDGFSITDNISTRAGVVAKEALNLADLCGKASKILLQDEFGTTDKLTRRPKVVATDVVVLADYISRNATTVLKDEIALADTCSNIAVFMRDFANELSVASGYANTPSKHFSSAFGISDDEHNAIGKVVSEDLAVTEVFKKYLPIIRKFYETLSVAELKSNHVIGIKSEALTLTDLIIRACEGVLSDLHIVNTPMDFEQFVEMAKTPALFNPFMDFKVGEYEYKDAIVKVRLSTTTQETFPSLVNCTMHVDIPDTDDRGTVEITDATAPTKVHYNKFYYNPPEVIVVLRGGNTADGMVTPNIVSTELSDSDGRYFEVELLDSYGIRKTGSISWTSKGY